MKERIWALGKGKLNYEPVRLQLSKEQLRLVVVAGSKVTDTFRISNAQGTTVKGYLCSDEHVISFTSSFQGEDNEITYTICALTNIPGDMIEGVIYIVTDCGEVDLPYHIDVVEAVCSDDKGIISDYDALTERIRANYEEGANIFHSKEFKDVFLLHDDAKTVLYEGLVSNNSKLQSVEEFLLACNKKEEVYFSVEKEAYTFEIEQYEIEDALMLSVNTWGSIGIKISSSEEFVVPEYTEIWTNEFIGGKMTVPFVINGKKVKRGRLVSSIFLESPYQKQEIKIQMHRKEGEIALKKRIYNYKMLLEFQRNIINHKLGKMTEREFFVNLKLLTPKIWKCEHSLLPLLKGYSLVMLEDVGQNELKFEKISAEKYILSIENMERPEIGKALNEVLIYLGGLYLKMLYVWDEEENEEIVEEVRRYYENGYHDWQVFYLLLKMDSRYETIMSHTILEELEEFIEAGSNSPLLYIEALQIYKQNTSQFNHLTPCRIQIIYYGMKEGFFDEDFAITLAFLTDNYKKFSYMLFRCLFLQYKMYELECTLQAICSYLIRNEKMDSKYFSWFALGIEKNMRITELFEYYMNTLDQESKIPIPKNVITYFQFENHLNDSLKAYLYATIIKERIEHPKNLVIFCENIREFAFKKLSKYYISRDLGIIYEGILGQDECKGEIAQQLPFVMFQHRLTCKNSNIEGVCIDHYETKERKYYPIRSGVAMVEIYTPNYQIFFIDKENHYHVAMIDYTLERLINPDKFAMTCYENGSDHKYLLLYLFSKMKLGQVIVVSEVILCDMLRKEKILRPLYQEKVLFIMYQCAKSNNDSKLLAELLEQMDFDLLNIANRNECISQCIKYKMNDKAYAMIKKYGFDCCDKKDLLTLVTWYIKSGELQNNREECSVLRENAEFTLRLCHYLFRHDLTNEVLMQYLVQNFVGKVGQLYAIYIEAKKKGLPVEEVKERILAQHLFVSDDPMSYYSLYYEYYKTGQNRILMKALLNYVSYGFVVDKYNISEQLFTILQKESIYEDNDIIILAILKYYSNQNTLSDQERESVDYHISRLEKEGIVMKFMQRFIGQVTLPYNVQNTYLVQHFTNTKLPVTIRIKDVNGETSIVPMRMVYSGIFVKEFLMFEGEVFTYEIIEEETGEMTEKRRMQMPNRLEENSFHSIVNDMTSCKKKGDSEGYQSACNKYFEYENLAKKLLKPL